MVTQKTVKLQHLKAKGVHQAGTAHSKNVTHCVLGRKSKKKRQFNRAHSRVLFFGCQLRKKDKGVKLLPSQVCCEWEGKSPRWEWISHSGRFCLLISQGLKIKGSPARYWAAEHLDSSREGTGLSFS